MGSSESYRIEELDVPFRAGVTVSTPEQMDALCVYRPGQPAAYEGDGSCGVFAEFAVGAGDRERLTCERHLARACSEFMPA